MVLILCIYLFLWVFIYAFGLSLIISPLNGIFNHFMWVGKKYEELTDNWYKYKNHRNMELCDVIEFYETCDETDNISFNKKQAYGIEKTAKDISECLNNLGEQHKIDIMGLPVEYFFSVKSYVWEHIKTILLVATLPIFLTRTIMLMYHISPILFTRFNEKYFRFSYRFYRGVLIHVPGKKLYVYISFIKISLLNSHGKIIYFTLVPPRYGVEGSHLKRFREKELFNQCIQVSGITDENREFVLELESKITEKLKQNSDIKFLTPNSTQEDIKIN